MPALYKKSDNRYGHDIDMSKCRAQTYNSVSRNFSQCARGVAIERDGIGYCRQHDPEAEKARSAARLEREQAEARRRARQWQRPRDYRDALREIAEETKKQQLPITSRVHTIAIEALAKWNDLATE